MRIALGFCVLLCLAILRSGIHLVLQEQRQVTSFSATATAIVLKKQVEEHRYESHDPGDPAGVYEPVVTFRYEVHGRQSTGNRVFPAPFLVGGNLGRAFVQATLARFEVGQEVPVYYMPASPPEACLIRRPSLLLYLGILGPAIILGLIVCFWPSPQARNVDLRRRKGRWIATLWHLAGLAGGVHYFYVAGADYAATGPWLFGIYTYVGLIPVAVALPSSRFAQRVKNGIEVSVVGAFIGPCLGGGAGCVADLVWPRGQFIPHLWAAYTAVVVARLLAMLRLLGLVTCTPVFSARS